MLEPLGSIPPVGLFLLFFSWPPEALGQGFHEIQAFGAHPSTSQATKSTLSSLLAEHYSSSNGFSTVIFPSRSSNIPSLSTSPVPDQNSTLSAVKKPASPELPQKISSSQPASSSSPPATTHQTPAQRSTARKSRSKPSSTAALSTSSGVSHSVTRSSISSRSGAGLQNKSSNGAIDGNSVAVGIGSRLSPTSTIASSQSIFPQISSKKLTSLPITDTLYTSTTTRSPQTYQSISRDPASGLTQTHLHGTSAHGLPEATPLSTGPNESLELSSSRIGYQAASRDSTVPGSIPTGTAAPYITDSSVQCNHGNLSSIDGSRKTSGFASGITLGTGFTANATQASILWGRQPACTASWKSRLAANNGTVMTTRVDSRTVALPTPFTSTWAVSEYITGPTTETIKAGTVAYQLNGLDECCGECRILYPNVQVYYWPVKKNSNTWCLQYNFTSSVTASTDTNFDNGKLVFGTLPSDNSVPTDHPTLTTPESDGLPTNLPTLPGVSRGSPNDFPTLSGIPIRPSHSSHSISSTDSHISVNPSKTKSTLSVSPTFGIPLPPRAILQSSITKSASLPGNSAKTLKARTFIPLNGTEVYALAPDGKNSFTSPTIYVVISTISARDSCGMLGNAYTSLTIPFDASELSTVDGITDKTAIFNFADLPCPPHEWVEDKTVPNPLMGNSAMRSDYAKDYHPRILVPHQTLKDIDPSWARSSCVIEDVGQGYDPPRQLVPVTALTADSTSSLDPRTSSAAQPQSQAQDPASRPTCKACLKPDFHTPVSPQIPNATPNDPSQPVEPDPATPNAVPIPSAVPVPSAVVIGGQTLANSGQPVHFISNTEVPNPQAIPLTVGPNIVPGSTQPVHTLPQSMPPANPITINGLTLTPTSIPPQDPQVVGESPANESPTVPGVVPGASPNVPASAASQNGPQPGNGSPEPVVIGGLTMTPQAAAPSQVPKQAQPGSMLVVAAGVTLTRVVSSASGFGGLSNGEPALINVGEQPLSFKPAPVFTIGGSTFIGNPSSIQVGNTVLSKGEPAITIANTPLSLGPAGLVVGSETIPAASLNGVQPSSGSIPAYVVGGQTLSVGGPGINVKGTSLSVASQGILVGGQTLSIPSATALPTVAGQQIRTQPNGNIIVHGITIQAGGPPATIDGSTLSMLPSGNAVVVNGQSTVSISRIPTVAGQQVRPAPSGLVIIGSQILTPGAQATISSTRVSVLHSGGIVVGGSTVAFTSFSTPASDQQPSIFSIDGTALTSGSAPITVHGTVLSLGSDGLHMGSSMMPYASISNLVNGASPSITAAPFSHGYLIGGQILQPGRAITISGTIVSLGSSSSELIVGGTRTFNLAPSASLASIFAVGGQVFTAAVNGFPIDGTSLYPGQATTIAHTRVSLNPIGLVIGTATYPLLSPSSGSIFALEGQSLTANPSGYSIGGGELTPGGEVTVSGTLISLAATGAIVIGGSRTVPLAAMTPGKAESVFTRSSGGYAVDGTEVPSSSVALVTVSGHITSELVTAVVVDSSTKVVNGGSSGIATTSSSSVGRAARKEVARGLLVTMGIILGGVVMSV